MILDSSVLVAIVLREPGFEALVDRLRAAELPAIGAPTLVEAAIVLSARLGADGQAIVDRFLRDFEVATLPFGERHWREAVDAYARFGRGLHPAALNFGDCLSYATARLAGQPLLFVGDDFSRTDLEPA